MSKVHKNDVGTIFRFIIEDEGVVLNISTATTVKRMLFQKPSGATLTKAASFTTDGTDGKIQYTTVAGDIDEAGEWKYQGYVEITGWSGSTPAETFQVAPTLV